MKFCSILLSCNLNFYIRYSFIGEVQSNLAKFHGCLISIQQSFPHFVVDVFYSHSVKHTASLVRRLCETTRDASHVFTKQDWVRRNWLAEESSKVLAALYIITLVSSHRNVTERVIANVIIDNKFTITLRNLRDSIAEH